MVIKLYPVNKLGFIDEDEIYKLAYGFLKLPFGSLEDLTPIELSLLIDSNHEVKKDEYETMYHMVRLAYISAQTGKTIPLFEDNKVEDKSVTREKREADLGFLKTTFEG